MLKNNILDFKKNLNLLAEIGWQEVNTTDYIAKTLKVRPIKRGFRNKNTGLLYKIGNGKKAILLRADIDGLMTKTGVKHTCGHSSHIAGLMGAFLDSIPKTTQLSQKGKAIYFLFQPAEESYPSGAETFLKECKAILPGIESAFAIHVRPLMLRGEIGLVNASVFAGADYLAIDVFGKTVHIKNTPEGIDALEGASQIILYFKALQKQYEKNLRINLGTISGGLQPNTVAGYALLKGDIRYKDDKLAQKIRILIKEELTKIEKSTKVKIKLNKYGGCPLLLNNSKLYHELFPYLKKETHFKINTNPSLFSYGCEDFAFISQKIPSLFALIGTDDKYDIHEVNCTISDPGTLSIYKYFSAILSWWVNT